MQTKLSKHTLIGIGAALVVLTAVVGYVFYTQNTTQTGAGGTERTVVDDTYGISFSFPEGEDAFTLIEPPVNQAGIQKSYILLPTKAYIDYQQSDNIAEAPAGINVFILTMEEEGNIENATTAERADRMTRLKDWAMRFDGLTQYSQKKAEPEEIEIDGLKTLKYQTEGLYQQTIYLATYKDNVYMLVGQYTEQSDITYTTFEQLLKTISFN